MTQDNQHPESASPERLENTHLYAVPHKSEIETQRLSVRSAEDVLAYIQSTLGFRPTNSLVVVAFAGNQLSTVVRCDLPDPLYNMLRSDTPESIIFMDYGLTESLELQFIDVGRHIGQLVAKEPSTTSCLLLYLSEDVTVSDHQALSAAGTANSMITAQFGLQRVRVEESWLLHHSLLWHLRCTATTECTVQGNAVGNPEHTPIFRALDPNGTTTQERVTSQRLVFPQMPLAPQNTTVDTQGLLEHRPYLVIQWLRLWEEHLMAGPQMLHSNQVEKFLASLEHPRIREAVLALACFDFTTMIRGMVALGQFPAELSSAVGLQTHLLDGVTVKDCITGQSERSPDWQQIRHLEQLCRQLLPLSDARSGGVVAGILVWVEWVRGRGSIAMTYVKQARKRFPGVPLLITLEDFLRQGLVAGWATRSDSAWSPQHAA